MSVKTKRKTASEKMDQIGRISVDGDHFTIASDGKIVAGLLNGYKVVDAALYKDPIPVIVPTMATLIAKSFRDKWYNELKVEIFAGEWDTGGKYPSKNYLEALLNELSRILGADNLQIHKQVSEPILIDNPTISLNQESLLNNLTIYHKKIDLLGKHSQRLLEKAEAVTRIRLIDSIWGIDKVIEEIQAIKDLKEEIEDDVFDLGSCISISLKAVARMKHRITSKNKITDNDKKYISTILIPDILVSFDNIRNVSSKILTELSPLYYIEETFRAHTGNPVSWSIPSNIIEDIKESFNFMIEFLVDVPSVEIDIMEPLEILQASLIPKDSDNK